MYCFKPNLPLNDIIDSSMDTSRWRVYTDWKLSMRGVKKGRSLYKGSWPASPFFRAVVEMEELQDGKSVTLHHLLGRRKKHRYVRMYSLTVWNLHCGIHQKCKAMKYSSGFRLMGIAPCPNQGNELPKLSKGVILLQPLPEHRARV